MMNGKSPLDATGVPVASNGYYVVKVPAKFARAYGRFDNVVIPSENVDPTNRVVRLGPTADKWIRTSWLHRVHLDPVLSLEREKVAGEVAMTLAKNLGSKVLGEVSNNTKPTRRLRKVGAVLVAAAVLVAVGSCLRGFVGSSQESSQPQMIHASFENVPAPVLVNFIPKNSE